MQEQDIQAWEREINHAQIMRESREGWELKEGWDGKQPIAATSHSDAFNEE